MQTDITKSLLEKIPKLTLEKQQELLKEIDKMLEEKASRKTVWELWEERMKNVPQEELDELPIDASANFDHYLYGAPKK